MVNNRRLSDMRISEKTFQLLEQISKAIGLTRTALARALLVKGLKQLKSDSIKAGGFDKFAGQIRS